MDNILLLGKSSELLHLGTQLGFSRTLFLEDTTLLTAEKPKEILYRAHPARQQKKLVIFRPSSEEALRFALEKSPVHMVLGVEQIHPHDSLHYPRSGLNQVLCRLAAARGITVGFSFAEILQCNHRARLLTRMMFNIKLCHKYKVKMFFSNFSSQREEMRSAEDLFAFWRLLGGRSKEELGLS